MVEVLVSVMILGGGLVILASLQAKAMKINADTSERMHALFVAQEMVERMRANEAGVESAYLAASNNDDLCNAPPAVICADDYTNMDVDAQSCSATQMATFDLWDIKCDSGNAGIKSSTLDFFDVQDLNITCAPVSAGVCSNNALYTIEVVWASKLVADNQASGLVDTTESTSKSVVVEVHF